ncbi:hypothetical protein TNCV_1354101 [Trichonephila clavipes]|nr:hypothetical protein TNCV_1354101 [Trichonephila clavipes]
MGHRNYRPPSVSIVVVITRPRAVIGTSSRSRFSFNNLNNFNSQTLFAVVFAEKLGILDAVSTGLKAFLHTPLLLIQSKGGNRSSWSVDPPYLFWVIACGERVSNTQIPNRENDNEPCRSKLKIMMDRPLFSVLWFELSHSIRDPEVVFKSRRWILSPDYCDVV